MTSFAILWKFLKSKGWTQESFSEELNIQTKTLRRWRDMGFGHANMDPDFLCKVAFCDKNGDYNKELVKGFLQHIRKYGYSADSVAADLNNFGSYFSGFLSGDDVNDNNCPHTEPPTVEYAMPPHFINRKDEIDHLIDNAFATADYKVHAIVGERGLGKTTLALSYANEAIKEQKFKQVITVSYAGSIKKTVEHINVDIFESGGNIFTEKIMMLKRMKNTLLIIDNYDNPDFKDELAGDEPDYLRLLDTECSILITSTCDLGKCYCIDDNITCLSPLSTESLVSLYFNVKGDENDSVRDVTELIEKYLLCNTYLIVLSAELSKQGMSAEQIIASIKELKTDDTDFIATQKDGKRQDEKNLLDHYCCVLENNKIINPYDIAERNEVWNILSLLALLPIGGMRRTDLEEISCGTPMARKSLKKVISRLKKHSLVFENGADIYLQPVVKEYLVRNTLIFGKYVYTFLSNLSKKLDIHTYNDSLLYWLDIAESAYAVINDEYIGNNAVSRTLDLSENADLDKAYETVSLSALLCCKIISCYNAINLYHKAHEYALLALPGLKNARHSMRQELDIATLAYCYSTVGHALSLGSGDDANKRDTLSCLKTAKEYAEQIDDPKLLTKIHGEFASYYLKIKDYSSALNYHTAALGERMLLAKEYPEDEEIGRMIAFTYRGIGTDHFYLAQKEDPKEHLDRSYKYHLMSVNIFEELYGIHRLETVTGLNRLIGTGILLIGNLCDCEEIQASFGRSPEELCEVFFKYISDIFEFYGGCTFALNFEIENSLKNLDELTKLMIGKGTFTEIYKELTDGILSDVKALPMINDACLSLCSSIESHIAN